MKNKIKIAALAMAISAGIYTPQSNASGLPVVDPASLVENVSGNIQDAAQWVSESGLMTMAMEMQSMYSQAMMQLDGVLGQVSIQKELKLEEELHNLWVKEINEPDPMAVNDCATSEITGAVDCYQADENIRKLDEDQAKSANFTETPVEAQKRTEAERSAIVEACKALTFGEAEDEVSELTKSYCLNGGLVSGVGVGPYYNATQKAAVDQIILLLSGTATEHKPSQTLTEGTDGYNSQILKEMKELAIRNLAMSSLTHVAGVRSSASESSSMQTSTQLSLLEDVSNERWLDTEWLNAMGSTSQDVDDNFSPTVIQRQQAKMQAFQIHLDIIKYKQQLRMENLMSVNLLLDLDSQK